MSSFLGLTLLPILLVDLINPILLAAVVYGLGSRRPMLNTGAILASFFACYLASGIVISLIFEWFTELYHLPATFDYAIELVVALLLIGVGWSQLRSGDTHPEERLEHVRSMHLKDALFLGLQVNFVGLPFAIPYFAAIDQILKAHFSALPTVLLLVLYNALYIFPFALLLGVKGYLHEESKDFLERVNQWVHNVSVQYLPWIFIGLAFLLLEDCISFFLGYREYSFMSLF